MRGSKTALRDMSYVCCIRLLPYACHATTKTAFFASRDNVWAQKHYAVNTIWRNSAVFIEAFVTQRIFEPLLRRVTIQSVTRRVFVRFLRRVTDHSGSQRPNMPIRHMPISPFIGEPTARQAHATWPMRLQ